MKKKPHVSTGELKKPLIEWKNGPIKYAVVCQIKEFVNDTESALEENKLYSQGDVLVIFSKLMEERGIFPKKQESDGLV